VAERLTPLTEMLGVYRRLHEAGQGGLQAHAKLAKELSSNPAVLESSFLLSVAQFARYANPRQFFHEGQLGDGAPSAAPGVPISAACAATTIPPTRRDPSDGPVRLMAESDWRVSRRRRSRARLPLPRSRTRLYAHLPGSHSRTEASRRGRSSSTSLSRTLAMGHRSSPNSRSATMKTRSTR
jgi:hypothetical protein